MPGAKPLPINEVRLSKEDDEDRDRHRSNDKRYNSSDNISDKTADENAQKNSAAKKGNGKVDNHIGTYIHIRTYSLEIFLRICNPEILNNILTVL